MLGHGACAVLEGAAAWGPGEGMVMPLEEGGRAHLESERSYFRRSEWDVFGELSIRCSGKRLKVKGTASGFIFHKAVGMFWNAR